METCRAPLLLRLVVSKNFLIILQLYSFFYRTKLISRVFFCSQVDILKQKDMQNQSVADPVTMNPWKMRKQKHDFSRAKSEMK